MKQWYTNESQESVQQNNVESSSSASPVAKPFPSQFHRRTEILHDDMDMQSGRSDGLSNDTHTWDRNPIYANGDSFLNPPGLIVQVKQNIELGPFNRYTLGIRNTSLIGTCYIHHCLDVYNIYYLKCPFLIPSLHHYSYTTQATH